MKKEPKKKQAKSKIKDLPPNINLRGVKFHDPKTGTTGYWFSQWGYENGKAGIWWKKDMKSGQVFPLFLDDLKEALEFYVVEER
jgi:hypothetical protein